MVSRCDIQLSLVGCCCKVSLYRPIFVIQGCHQGAARRTISIRTGKQVMMMMTMIEILVNDDRLRESQAGVKELHGARV